MGLGTPGREWQWNRYHIKEYEQDGVTIRVLEDAHFTTSTTHIRSVFNEVNKGNAWIKDQSMQVKQVFVTVTGGQNEFRTYGGKPLVTLDYQAVNISTVRHEMGHAIFDYYRSSKSAPEGAALQVAALFTKLQATKHVEKNVAVRGGTEKDMNWPAGIWVVDPSQWASGRLIEHPNDDAEEFFASAREAFMTDPHGLQKAIEKFAKYDQGVRAPAKRLKVLLGELRQFKVPSAKLDKSEIASGQEELSSIPVTPAHETAVDADLRLSHTGVLQMVADPVNSKAKAVGGTSIKKTIPAVQPRRSRPPSQRKSTGVFGTLFTAMKSFFGGDESPDAPAVNKRVRPLTTQPSAQFPQQSAYKSISAQAGRQLRDHNLKEQQRIRDQQQREQKARDQRAQDQQQREKKARDQRAQDQQQREKKARDQQAQDQQQREKRSRDERTREAVRQRQQDQQRRDQQQREQTARDQKARDEQRRLEQLIRSQPIHGPRPSIEANRSRPFTPGPGPGWDRFRGDGSSGGYAQPPGWPKRIPGGVGWDDGSKD